MQKYLYIFVGLVFLSGCASISKQAGFSWQKHEGLGQQVLWHNLVLEGDLSTIEKIGVAQIPSEQKKKIPWEFKREARYYFRIDNNPKSDSYGKLISTERSVLRALLYRDEKVARVLEAVAYWKRKDKIYVFFPEDIWGMQNAKSLSLVILSPDASLLMTTNGEVIEIPEGQSLTELPQGFFREHSSKIPTVLVVQRGDRGDGDKFFMELEELFPSRFEDPEGRLYSGHPETNKVAGKATLQTSYLDRIISCGSFPISPLALFSPVTAGISLGIPVVRNTYVAINGCQ
jgi:hypothetical protein